MKTRVLRALGTLAVSGTLSAGSALAGGADVTPLPAAKMTGAPTSVTTPAPKNLLALPVGHMAEAPPASACGSGPGCATGLGAACCEPEPTHAYGAFGDFIYLKARGVDQVFARTVDGCLPDATPRGPLGIAQPTYSPGFRVGGFVGWEDSSIVATYTWFNSQAHESIAAAPNTVIQSLVNLPNTQNCAANSQLATAGYDIDFQFIDVDYRHAFCTSCYGSVDYIIGVRYAHLDQDFRTDFNILGTTTVESNIRFDGVGPRVGLAGERIGKRGLLAYGRGSASFLAGHFSGTYRQFNTFAGSQGELNYDNDRIVPILDLEVGVGWASESGRFRVEAGYWVMGWFNTLTTPGLVRGAQTNEFSGTGDVLRDTIGFDGFTVRAAMKF